MTACVYQDSDSSVSLYNRLHFGNLSLLILYIYIYIYILSQCMGRSKEKQDNMVVIPRVITKLLPSRQIVHSTQQVVYLAHANMHTNHLLVYSGCHYCKQVL